ncbi:hypothetical protein LOTGIDRAFT_154137 [Lottia gigantea]|uniref:TIR domain-containing protein n=1 Tax=Lottia gigantea TaxID=225164 RepID=V4BKF7_LOTGI|nr:hypothetical protein LOTGIDRAFT_154137 [Lottia gigantea]ESO89059.1 hypothetical protein LOTGIDRAFT_154137 [Lottia gigantea]
MSYCYGLRILLISILISMLAADYPYCGNDCSTNPCSCCIYDTSGLIELSLDVNCQEPNRSRIIEPGINSNDDSYLIYQIDSCLTKLPENICEFPKIKSIVIKENKITEVPNLSCLSELVYLDLSYNKITTLKTGIFDSLTKLSVIRLQYNEIKTIEAGVFHMNLNSIKKVDLNNNKLTKLDVWSFFNITHKFCRFNVSYNQINQLINEKGRKIQTQTNDVHGPGFVDFRHNHLQIWIIEVMKSLGFPTARKLGYFLLWGFDFRDNPWICDCVLYDIMSIVKNFKTLISRNYFQVYCSEPRVELFFDMELEEFVCNVTERCPPGCLCQDQPAFKRFFIDCQNSGLNELPVHLPRRKNLHLNFNNNSINRLDNRKYLKSVEHLDLSDNNITFISPQSIDNLNSLDYLNLNNNSIEYLPENIQKLRLSKLDIDNNVFICNCSNVWMSKWLKSKEFIKDGSNITCTVENNRDIVIQDMNIDILDCRPIIISKIIIIPIIVSLVIVIIIIVICIYLRYELLTIYYLKFKFRRHVLDEFKYDVYISCDEERDEDRIWIQENILQLFDNLGLKCYISFRDGMGGEITVDKNITTIHNSRIVLVLASDTYITNSKNMIEFNEIYHQTISNKNRELILIKRGLFQSSKIKNGYIRSLFRLKLYLYSNDENLTKKMIKSMNLKFLNL